MPGRFRGDVFHSRDYASPGRFAGKRVVVVGAGETAFDVAHGAASAGARAVTMSTRRGFVSVPASFGEGVAPLDCIIANAGTHCWESAWARRVGLHWWITTKFQRLGMLILGGSSTGWNQWVGEPLAPVWNVEVRDGEAGIGPDTLAVLIDEPRAGILEGFALTSGQLPNALLSRAGNR